MIVQQENKDAINVEEEIVTIEELNEKHTI